VELYFFSPYMPSWLEQGQHKVGCLMREVKVLLLGAAFHLSALRCFLVRDREITTPSFSIRAFL
jgi:hypothetical protein